MAFCNHCGAQLAEGVKFCPQCGTTVGAAAAPVNQQPPQPAGQPVARQPQQPDTATGYDPKDIEANKVMALLSYLGILVLVPLFAAKESKFARFHANQGLILCLAAIAYGVAYSIVSSILLALSWRLYTVVSLIGLLGFAFAVWAVIGIINSLNGKAKELPVIGKYKILK